MHQKKMNTLLYTDSYKILQLFSRFFSFGLLTLQRCARRPALRRCYLFPESKAVIWDMNYLELKRTHPIIKVCV